MIHLKHEYDVAVIGGGAAGMISAIGAARKGASVLICEKMPKLGKKILISGAGRCNLLNDVVDPSFYNREAKDLVASIFSRFGKEEQLKFFRDLGVIVYSDGGKIYPVTNQATSVMEVLEFELSRQGVNIEFQAEVTKIEKRNGYFLVTTRLNKQVKAGSVVVCGGGRSYPVSGSDGSIYKILTSLGHKIVEPVPSTVPIIVKDNWFHNLHGQKIRSKVTAEIDSRIVSSAEGDILFTKYGLSGTAILDVSEEISIAINRLKKKDVTVIVDLVPFLEEKELEKELTRRIDKGFVPEKLIMGILPHKFRDPLADILRTRSAEKIAAYVKHKNFHVDGTLGWDEAEFTAGGIETNEIFPKTLESKKIPGLYIAGEVLNVQGKRGGYNLAWAWASGYVAGEEACSHAGSRGPIKKP